MCFRMLEERTDPLGRLLQIAQPAEDRAQEISRAVHKRARDAVVLHVVPDELVRIELGGVESGKKNN